MTEFKVGIHRGLTYMQYDQIDALRASDLKEMRRSMAHYYYKSTHSSESSKSMVIGDATHAAILEPDRFLTDYTSMPEHDKDHPWSMEHKNTNLYKNGVREWELEHEGKVIVRQSDYNKCVAMRDSVWAHPVARKILSGKGMNEVVICWKDPSTDLPCKARLDRLTDYTGHTLIVDVKSCKDASERELGYACYKYGYHLQFAFYRRGLNELDSSRTRKCFIIAPENTAPHCVAVYEVDKEAVNCGELIVQNLMYEYADCIKKGYYPGYSSGVEKLFLPKFAYNEEGSDEDNNDISEGV